MGADPVGGNGGGTVQVEDRRIERREMVGGVRDRRTDDAPRKTVPADRPVDMGQESSDPFPRFEQGTLYMEPRAVQDRVHGKRLSDRLAGRAGRGRDGRQDASGGLSGVLSPQFSAEGG